MGAAFFHLYLSIKAEWSKKPEALTKAFSTPRHVVAYIVDTFPIVKRKEEARFNGDYRPRNTILALYDQFAEASTSGKAFTSPLNPPPGEPR